MNEMRGLAFLRGEAFLGAVSILHVAEAHPAGMSAARSAKVNSLSISTGLSGLTGRTRPHIGWPEHCLAVGRQPVRRNLGSDPCSTPGLCDPTSSACAAHSIINTTSNTSVLSGTFHCECRTGFDRIQQVYNACAIATTSTTVPCTTATTTITTTMGVQTASPADVAAVVFTWLAVIVILIAACFLFSKFFCHG